MTTKHANALDDFKTISEEQKQEFRKNGHTLVRNVLAAEAVPYFQRVIGEAAQQHNEEKRKLQDRDTYGKAFLQIMNLWLTDEEVKRFVLAKRFAKIADRKSTRLNSSH